MRATSGVGVFKRGQNTSPQSEGKLSLARLHYAKLKEL